MPVKRRSSTAGPAGIACGSRSVAVSAASSRRTSAVAVRPAARTVADWIVNSAACRVMACVLALVRTSMRAVPVKVLVAKWGSNQSV